MKIQDYKEFEIEYSEGYDEGFSVVGSDIHKSKLSEIKKYIDRIKSNKFERFKTLKIDYVGRTDEVEVTSYDHAGYFWIKDYKGRREKIDWKSLLKPNQGNKDNLIKIDILRNKQKELREEINKIQESLERLDPEDYREKDT